jgi:hypothetical protein
MRKLALLVLAVGLTASSANAAVLWMEFRGAGDTVTMAPSDYATIDIWLTPRAWDTGAAFDNVGFGFNVDVIELMVQSVSVPQGWTDLTIIQPTNPNNMFGPRLTYVFFAAAGPMITVTDTTPILLMDIVLHKTEQLGDVSISFEDSAAPPLPDISNQATPWFKWTLPGEPMFPNSFVIGQDDLSVINIPEPASLALLALGGLAIIRRR